MIRRSEFITLLGGAAAWPLAARGQQPAMPVIAVLRLGGPGLNPPNTAAFRQGLAEAGYIPGRNVRMDFRWDGGDADRLRALAKELVSLQPDIILTGTIARTVAVQRETRTIPIVFTGVGDPVASGIVAALKVVPIPAPVHSDAEIETAITALGREPGGGLVVIPSVFVTAHRAPIISAAARNNLPAVYTASNYAREGGLLSYGPDPVDTYRRAATYVDRILRGEKPGDLPVQLPTKFEMVVNLKTAKALGLTVPPSLLARADEVIE